MLGDTFAQAYDQAITTNRQWAAANRRCLYLQEFSVAGIVTGDRKEMGLFFLHRVRQSGGVCNVP